MRKSLSQATKVFVAERANYRCEYCLISENLSFYKFQIEHIISIKHDGDDQRENLAYCCPECNYSKGTDIGTFIHNKLTRFFNPRTDNWMDHFTIKNGEIIGKTDIGKATVNILKFNQIDRLIFRNQLISMDLYF
ncbi:HNH endonuclease [Lacihabitans soyangensis]|uniref:HNH endonuclease n=1 Tax=Lacihabitans soyangensis TaxID=869394 RepID=A0AAE3H3P0_9BACT|nr:HNH endonuclease signature motif containing protein [Lacihabitans soyangensis]MCP9764357.1 HNH endonuclease [Lacihabitans soyangensis]